MKALYFGLVGLAIAVIAMLVTLDSPGAGKDEPEAAAVPHFQTAVERRIQIVDDARVSRNQDPMYVQLVSGTIPSDVSRLTVLTDENCAPDADGVSHCINRVSFAGANGTGEAVLRHHHDMSEESCLAPGEVVVIAA